jgi:hypothetical protein
MKSSRLYGIIVLAGLACGPVSLVIAGIPPSGGWSGCCARPSGITVAEWNFCNTSAPSCGRFEYVYYNLGGCVPSESCWDGCVQGNFEAQRIYYPGTCTPSGACLYGEPVDQGPQPGFYSYWFDCTNCA